MSRKGIFVGSFDPFTIGHADIVSRALPLFDTIVIGVGMNESKLYMQSAKERCRRIKEAYKDEPRIEVQTYGDLTVDFALCRPALRQHLVEHDTRAAALRQGSGRVPAMTPDGSHRKAFRASRCGKPGVFTEQTRRIWSSNTPSLAIKHAEFELLKDTNGNVMRQKMDA